MGYSADSFSAGEQPTTAKWNKLWTNDSSFNDMTGVAPAKGTWLQWGGANGVKLAASDGSLRLGQIYNRQQTTNTLQDMLLQTGWDYTQGTSTSRVDKTITFPLTFSTILGVSVSFGGIKITAPSSITDTGPDVSSVCASTISTSQFTVSVIGNGGSSLGTNFFAYSWAVWGIKA